ncbi:polysaccharide deacetylase family protein [Longispora sp. K20-0274]|uniref:polysaccharide deacetylase family protein n=1 Tax=Longispora sp. K20-0274 TaxID=3088255 RepID=UPI00399B6602
MGISRRGLLRGTLLAAGGALAGAGGVLAAERLPRWLGPDRQPIGGGYAPGSDRNIWADDGQQTVTWHVTTDQPLVALTFDDGPGPNYTPKVLDALDSRECPATFFMVGERVQQYHGLIDGRLDRHEVGNHTWNHVDLAEQDFDGVTSQLRRTHAAIVKYTGKTPRLMRPPWGHLGGSTLLAANAMNYNVALWSHQMREKFYQKDPAGNVRYIVEGVRPGAVILAHDYGDPLRLVTLDHLGEMIDGIRARGLKLVTLSELLAVGDQPIRD